MEKGGEALLIFGFGNSMVSEHGLQHFFLCCEQVFVAADSGGSGFRFSNDIHNGSPGFRDVLLWGENPGVSASRERSDRGGAPQRFFFSELFAPDGAVEFVGFFFQLAHG